METVTRNVRDIAAAERTVLEGVIGQKLADDQQVVIHVVSLPPPAAEEVPPWWNVYEGLSDEDVDRLDGAIRQRANLTRVFE